MDPEVNMDGGAGEGGEGGGPAPEILERARLMGWSDKEHFKGDPKFWVEAEEYVRRGEEVLPLVKAHNKRLQSEVATANSQIRELKGLIDAQTKTVEKIVKNQDTLVQKQVEERLQELRAQKRAAIREGNHDLAADLEEDIDKAKDDLVAVKTQPAVETPKSSESPADTPPWARKFVEENSDWLMKDKRRTALFQGIADDLLESGDLRGAELLEEAKRQMEETLSGGKRKPGPGKTESGTGSPSSGSSSGGVKGFNDLPADAKATCKAQSKLYVGPGKAFKTEQDWQAFFVANFEA